MDKFLLALLLLLFLLLPSATPVPATAEPAAVAPWLTFANGDDVRHLSRIEGVVWAGTQAGGAVRWEGVDRYRQYLYPQDGLASNDVRDIVAHAGQIWFATSRGLSALAPDGRWTTYTVENTGGGLPSDDVTALASAPDGSLWIGTRQRWTGREWVGGGLTRWHRGLWRVFTYAEGIVSLNVTDLAVTPSGEVWAAGQPHLVWIPPADPAPGFYQATGGGASVFRQDVWTAFHRDDENPAALPNTNTLYAVSVSPDGRVWFAASTGLLMVGPQGWRSWVVTGGASAANRVTALAADSGGRVWLAVTDPSGIGFALSILDTHGTPEDSLDDTWQHIPTANLPASTVQAILTNTDATAWLGLRETGGNGAGVTRVNTEGAVAEHWLTRGLNSNYISALAIAPDGGVWVGTGGVEAMGRGRGLNIFSPDGAWSAVRSEQRRASAAASLTRPVQVDDAEVYTGWSSLAAAEAALASGAFTLADDPTRYALASMYAVGSEVVLLLDTPITRALPAGAPLYPMDLSLGSDNIAGIAFAPDGAAWVAARGDRIAANGTGYLDGGLSRLKGGWQVQRHSATGLPNNNLSALAVGSDGRVWVGSGSLRDSTGAGVAVHQPSTGGWTRYTARQDGLISDNITSLLTTPQGEVWSTSAPYWINGSRVGGGVSRLRDGVWTHWTPASSPLQAYDNDVRAIGRDRRGGIWAGAWRYEGPSLLADWPGVEAVANRFAGGDWLAWTFPRAGWVTAIATAPDGNLWVGTSRGGYEPDPAPGGLYVQSGANWIRVDTSLGLPDNDIQSLAIAPDGVVWIGTIDHGVSRYNPAAAPLPTPVLATPTPVMSPTPTLTPAPTTTPGPIVSQIWLPLISRGE